MEHFTPLRSTLGGVLIGLSAWYVNMRLVMLLDPPREELRKLEYLVDTAPLFEALVMLAVFFRGHRLAWREFLAARR